MNRIFKRLFNQSLGVWQAVSEQARGHIRQGRAGVSGQILMAAGGLIVCSGAWAADLPQNGQVASGNASISQPNPLTLAIQQHSQKTILNWDSFSIGAGNTVNFQQPGRDAVALNRVTGNDPSAIYGSLNANGNVFLINQHGVLFADGANVNVGGLVASTLDIRDQDFLSGNYTFSSTDAASVINRGAITADGGAVALLGGHVSNEGIIRANLGSVALAAGENITLDFAGDGLINLSIDKGQLDALVENHGAIQADGGKVYLTTHAAGELLNSVVNNTGVIRAQTVEQREGKIILLADMQSGTARIDGTLDASAGGDASAPEQGNGGFIETSAANVRIADSVTVTTKSEQGSTGTWLIDPTDFTIEMGAGGSVDNGQAEGSSIGADTLETSLVNTSVIIETESAGNSTDQGDIHVNAAVTWNANTTLTLNAHHNIYLNAPITVEHGSGGLALNHGGYGHDGSVAANTGYHVHAPISFTAGSGGNFSVNGNIFTLIHNLQQLQDINSTGLSGRYALATDIDAGATLNWNNGAGFDPIGDNSNYDSNSRFNGTFDGLGHVISDLTIDRPNEEFVGLFGYTGIHSHIRHLGLAGGTVTGQRSVGGLVGSNDGVITQSYTTGLVKGMWHVGGLVGFNGYSVTRSYAMGSVSGNNFVGGLVGYNRSPVSTITQSYAMGSVSGNNFVGGLVGESIGSITQSYAKGFVSGGVNVGGLVGRSSGSITHSYAEGGVKGGRDVGSLVGVNNNVTLADSYYLLTDDRTLEATQGPLNTLGGVKADGNTVGKTLTLKAAKTVDLADEIALEDNRLVAVSSGDITLAAGAVLSSTTSGDVLVLKGVKFINHAGSNVLNASHADGRWLIYSNTPDDNTFGNLASGNQAIWNTAWSDAQNLTMATGNRYVFAERPELVLTSNFSSTKTYGDLYVLPTAQEGTHYSLSGFVQAADYGNVFEQDTATNTNLLGIPTFTSDGTIATANAGTYGLNWTVGTLTNTAGYGFDFASAGGSLVVNKRQLSALLTGSISRVYDGTTHATLNATNFTLVGLVPGENFTVTQTQGQYNNANVLDANTVTADLVPSHFDGINGALISNYVLPTSASGAGAINAKALTASLTGTITRVYDGTTHATLIPGNFVLGGVVPGESFTITQTQGQYNSRHVGLATEVNATLAASDFTVVSGALSNYVLPTSASGTGSISTASLVISSSDVSRVYDGTIHAAGIATVAGGQLFSSDGISGGEFAFEDRHAGQNKAVTVSDVVISDGNNGNNYAVTYQNNTSSEITAKTLTLSAVTDSRVYDGMMTSDGVVDIDGLVTDDTIIDLQQAFDSRHAGNRTLSVAGGYVIDDGNGGNNYTVVTETAAGEITQKTLTLSAVTDTRIYDGTTASDGVVDIGGLVTDDTIIDLQQAFDSRHAGDRTLSVAAGYVIDDGNGGNNYTVVSETASGEITPASLTISSSDVSRVYDGTIHAAGLATVVGGQLFSSDGISGGEFAFLDRHAGDNKTVTVSDVVIADGNNGSNYTITYQNNTSSEITAKILTLSAVTDTRTYDRTTVSSGEVDIDGLVAGDAINNLLQEFDSRHAGNRTLSVAGGYVINDGNDGNNYRVETETVTGEITAKSLVAILTALDKIFDGSTGVQVNYQLDGVVSGDEVDLSLAAAFEDAEVGSGKQIVLASTQLAGSDAGNYVLDAVQPSPLLGNILSPEPPPGYQEAVTNGPVFGDAGTPEALLSPDVTLVVEISGDVLQVSARVPGGEQTTAWLLGAGETDVGGLQGLTEEQRLELARLLPKAGSVLFPLNSVQVEDEVAVRDVTTAMVAFLKAYPQARVRLVGHADQSGPERLNERLSARRAEAVAQLLGEMGVRSNQIEVAGAGSTEPLRPGTSPAAMASNRRVDFSLP